MTGRIVVCLVFFFFFLTEIEKSIFWGKSEFSFRFDGKEVIEDTLLETSAEHQRYRTVPREKS